MESVNAPVPVLSPVQLSAVVGLAVVDQHTPWAVTVDPPAEVTLPPRLRHVRPCHRRNHYPTRKKYATDRQDR